MKRFFPAVLMGLVILALVLMGIVWAFSLLFAPKDPILASLPECEAKEFYSSGGFQDYTDYGKYTYRIYEKTLMENPYFQTVTEADLPRLEGYLDNFENWVAICQDFPQASYDFDRGSLEVGDYYYILNRYEEPEKEFWCYDLYYFDLDIGILYYFHSNI